MDAEQANSERTGSQPMTNENATFEDMDPNLVYFGRVDLENANLKLVEMGRRNLSKRILSLLVLKSLILKLLFHIVH